MILDLDTGVDDALALATAVGAPEVDLIGIISSYGNTLTEIAAQNSLNLLHLLDVSDVPVFLGNSHSSTTDSFEVMEISKLIHGKNGIGEIQLETSPRKIEVISGVDFLIESAHKYGENLIFVPTGPLTNLQVAYQKDPEIANLIGNVTLMGGALTIPGNVTPFTEANIQQDPFAADYVFKHAHFIQMVGLDVTMRTLLTKKQTAKWRALNTKSGIAMADIFDFYIDAYYNLDIDKRGAALHDPLAVTLAYDNSLAQWINLNLKVTTDGDLENGDWGRTIGDPNRLLQDASNSRVAVDVDANKYLDYFMKLTTTLFSKH
jgi:purine nucleosidase